MRMFTLAIAGLVCAASMGLMADEDEDAARLEARQRISPIVSDINMSDSGPTCGLKAGETYTLTWKIIAYGEDYNSTVAFFDCTGVDDYECGNTYFEDDRLLHAVVPQSSKVNHSWSYVASNGVKVYAYEYDFSTQITIPDNRDWEGDGSQNGPWNDTGDGGNKIVIRFYQKDDITPSDAGSVSLLIGARSEHSYGYYSRRVYNYVAEDTDPDNGICPMH